MGGARGKREEEDSVGFSDWRVVVAGWSFSDSLRGTGLQPEPDDWVGEYCCGFRRVAGSCGDCRVLAWSLEALAAGGIGGGCGQVFCRPPGCWADIFLGGGG